MFPPALDHVPDEISEMLDRHGRDLTARRLGSALERICDELERSNDGGCEPDSELRRELMEIVQCCRHERERSQLMAGLEQLARDLQSGSLEPDVALDPTPEADEPPRLVLLFDSAFSMHRTLPNLLDIRGHFLETDVRPMPLVELTIVVRAEEIEPNIALEGRVVRSAPNGIALRLYSPSPSTAERLRTLQSRMWSTRVGSART
jgi:hypothetical protein